MTAVEAGERERFMERPDEVTADVGGGESAEVVVDLRLAVGAADVRCADFDGIKRVVSVEE